MAAAGLAALTLAACTDFVGKIPKHLAPLEKGTKQLVEKKGMDQNAPILIRIFKEESVLEVWKKQSESGRYALLKDYEICAWSGVLGPKIKEGDRQAPEGFYTIRPAQMNPNSSYHLSFNMGYPNEFDRAHGRTGSELMVHGACSSRGCYSMQDEQIQEIYTLGRLAFEGGQRDFQVQAFPFRMTPENMARHRDSPHMPFWRMLKEGYDHFEAMRQTPKVDVCDKRYVFNSVPADGGTFKAASACPRLLMPEEIRVAVAEKDAKDDRKMMELAAKLDRKEGSAAADLMAKALAVPTTVAMAAPMSVGATPAPLDVAAPAAQDTAALPDAAPMEAPAVAAAAPAGSQPSAFAPALIAPEPTFRAPATAAPATDPALVVPTQQPSAPAVEVASPAAGTPLPPGAAEPAVSAPAVAQTEAAETTASIPGGEPATPAAADAASLEERMQAESAIPQPGVANAYAEPEPEEGLTGFVLRLFE